MWCTQQLLAVFKSNQNTEHNAKCLFSFRFGSLDVTRQCKWDFLLLHISASFLFPFRNTRSLRKSERLCSDVFFKKTHNNQTDDEEEEEDRNTTKSEP